MILTVTGHRPNKLGGYRTPNLHYNSVMEGLDRTLLEFQPERVITGMAMGVDQWMAELCVWNGVPFVAAIPFENFESKWYESTKRKYYELLNKAAEVVLVCQGEFASWKMQRRNEWMVDRCDRVAAVFDGTDGGTANTIGYARSSGKPIHYVHFIRPPPLVNNERPVIAAPVQVRTSRFVPPPTDPRPRPAAEVFRQMREENRRRQQEETEGQRAARRTARLALQQEETTQRSRLARALEGLTPDEVAEAVQRATRTAFQVRDVPEAPPEEPKSAVPEFARFVDLDV